MPEPLRECRERASHVISWARLSPADLRITGESVRGALPFLASRPGQLDGFGPVAAALARQIAADAARDNPSTTTWRCVVTDDEHGTVVGIGRPIVTPEHDAPLRVAALVRAAEGMCVFPGCSTPARRCDLDHRRPFPSARHVRAISRCAAVTIG